MSGPDLHILLAAPRGFCAGVVRAIDTVDALLTQRGPPLYVHHQVVHNAHVVVGFEGRGVVFVDAVDDVPSGAMLVISAHGAARSVFERAKARAITVVDATCPLVSKVHSEVARNSARLKRHILLVGHRGHAEMVGTAGQARGPVTLIETVEDAEALAVDEATTYAVATQTTLSLDDCAAITAVLRRRVPRLIEPRKADICYATTNRQRAVKALAAQCDAVIVVGGANSANSRQLVATAQSAGCTRTWFVSRGRDVDPEEFRGLATLGITSGASTPESLVEELIDSLRDHFDVAVDVVEVAEETERYRLPMFNAEGA